MSYWFDDLCKRLVADDTLSRRNVMRGLMATLAVSGVSNGAKALAQSFPVSTPTIPIDIPPGTCVRRTSAGKTVAQVSLKQGGITYQRQLSYDATTQTGTTSITINRGTALIFKTDATTTRKGRGDSAITIQYGAEIKGVQSATMKSQDGKTFQGTLDGRAFKTGASPHSMSDLKFADGAPTPKITMDPALGSAISALAAQVSKSFATCRDVAAPKPIRRFSSRETGQGGSPGSGWYEPGETYDAPDCTNCFNNCGSTATDGSGIDSFEVWICGPPCWATAIALYNAIWLACWGTCQLPGGGCCPVPCGGAFSCCGRNDNCFHSDLCCPGSMVVCKDVCCGPGITTCAPDGFCGCPQGQSVCGDNCCPSNTTCCAGQCCPAGTTTCCGSLCCETGANTCCGNQCCPAGAPCLNNTTCCASPNHVCPGSNNCCPPFNVCCGTTCCGLNEVCLTEGRTGQPLGCCPASQVCGVGGENPVCCPTGQTCVDTQNSTCAPCPPGQVSCRSSGNGAIVCCASGVNCCNGTCCKPLEICCTNIFGSPQIYGCHDGGLCTS